jgi:ABC-type spermidine/putrescine transport system permease subunit I
MILVLIVFPGLGNLASIILRFRLKVPEVGTFSKNQLKYLGESNFECGRERWVTDTSPVFFSVFFSGLSMQVSSALICHLVGYQMTWSATVKTVEASNFFKEVPAIIKKFRITLPINVLVIVSGMIPTFAVATDSFLAAQQIGIGFTSSKLVPEGWRVSNIEAIVPMAMSAAGHILYPSESICDIFDIWPDVNLLIAVVLNPWLVHFTF